jgi:hypothetical protein
VNFVAFLWLIFLWLGKTRAKPSRVICENMVLARSHRRVWPWLVGDEGAAPSSLEIRTVHAPRIE